MLIDRAGLDVTTLSGVTVLITGAAGGIGFEAARSLGRLGARVIIADIQEAQGASARDAINRELQGDRISFYPIDLSDDRHIGELYEFTRDTHGPVDVIVNNATIAPIGAVDSVSLADWDGSYAVNLRAPVALIRRYLPDMRRENRGTVVFVPSSGAAPYMGAYEVFKTAQVELCTTLAAELEGTALVTYSIGPGLVRTQTAEQAIEQVCSLLGVTTHEFYRMNEQHILDVEAAGAGFALSVVNARRYHGQEIGSIQALMDAGVFDRPDHDESRRALSTADRQELAMHLRSVVDFYETQYRGWLERSLFERQWVLRDFKKTVGMTAEHFEQRMRQVQALGPDAELESLAEYASDFKRLSEYFVRQHKLLQGFEKDPEQLREKSQIILGWVAELQRVVDLLTDEGPAPTSG